MRKIASYLLIFVFFTCNSSKIELVLSASNVEGVSESSNIVFNGLKIGEIESFNLKKNKVYIKTTLNNRIKIPTDSKFQIFSASLFGSKNIDVAFGKESKFFKNGDTIVLLPEKLILEKKLDTIEKIVLDAIQKTINVIKNDSIN